MKKFDYRKVDKELRFIAKFVNFFLGSSYTKRKFVVRDKLTTLLFKGFKRSKFVNYKQIFLSREDGSRLRVCVYEPKHRTGTAPAGVLWLHGGGYSMGEPEQDISFIEEFVKQGCVVFAPAYTKSIKNPYPAALNDCYLTLKWLVNSADKFDFDSSKVFVGGESAGGGLTVATTLLARDKAEVEIAFQLPIYPMIDAGKTPSSTNNFAPVWNSSSNALAWKVYLGDDNYVPENISKYASPANETDYSNLPPTFTYVGDIEPFKDETIIYVENLKKYGVPVHFKIFHGCFHGFDIVGKNTKIGKEARKFFKQGIEFALKNYSKPQKMQK